MSEASSSTAPMKAASSSMAKSEKKLASEGYTSQKSKTKNSKGWVKILQDGDVKSGVKGVLAAQDCAGDELIPYDHQRQAVKKAVGRINFIVLAHGCGTGKTATFFQLFAAVEVLVRGGAKAIVSVPAGTLAQWETTANDWLKFRNEDGAIFATNEQKKVTAEVIRKARVLIVSGGTLTAIFKSCFEKVDDAYRNDRGQPCKGWVRKRSGVDGSAVDLHPLYKQQYDLFGIDEAHRCRNEATALCEAHYRLSHGIDDPVSQQKIGGCTKRVALTATPIIHGPSNIVGLCKAIDSDPCYQRLSYWCEDKAGKILRQGAADRFKELYMDRVTDAVLDLPALTSYHSSFVAGLSPNDAEDYNRMLLDSRAIRAQLEQNNGKDFQLIKLMGKLADMQQQLVSPHLARVGAEQCKKSADDLAIAASAETGALRALREKVTQLSGRGHMRIIVACNHVMPMRVAMKYLRRTMPMDTEGGVPWSLFFYDGALTLKKRQEEGKAFFDAKKAILFLSIQAGGTGLHLVPPLGSPKERYCLAMIFWGSRPFSPQQVWQANCRIHRIGQVYETEAHHLICEGSVDYGIEQVHQDKKSLADAIVDGEWSTCGEDGNWRSKGRIVDNCRAMKPDGSNFEDMPPATGTAARHGGAGGGVGGGVGGVGRGVGGVGGGVAAVAAARSGDLGFFRSPIAAAAALPVAPPRPQPPQSTPALPALPAPPPAATGKRPLEEPPSSPPLGGRRFKMPMLAMGKRTVVTSFGAPPGVATQMPFGVAAMQTSQALSATALSRQAESFAGGARVTMEL